MRNPVALASVLAASLAAATSPAPRSEAAPTPADFALGQNTEKQPCRAQARFGRASAGRRVDIYCGEWERASGSLTLLPAARAEEALKRLAEDCAGERRALPAAGFQELSQISCQSTGALRRYGLFARHGDSVLFGAVYPADWGPLVLAAQVMTGSARPLAPTAQASTDTPGLQAIRAVYPEGAPGQAAAFNYELLRRRAYEKNAIWNFGSAERDFAELLEAHRRVSPDDVTGQAEIMSEVALNLSGSRRFDEAADMLRQAEAKAQEAGDRLLLSKIGNYRAIHLMNQRRFTQALATATEANAARAALVREQEGGGGFRISPAEARAASERAQRSTPRGVLLRAEGMSEADRASILSAQGYYIAGASARALGRAEARGHLERAVGFLSATRVPPPWMTALVRGELARVRLAQGDVRGAEAAVQQGLSLIRAAAPNSRAEGHLLLTAARVQRQGGRASEALATGRAAVDIFARQKEMPGLPSELADEHLDALHDAWAASSDPALAADYFETIALVWDGAAARSAAQLAARLAAGEAAGEARAYQDAERAYRAALARRQRLSAPEAEAEPELIKAAETQVREATAAYQEAEAKLRARSPRFLELLTPKVAAAELQGVLAPDEGYMRVVLSSGGGHGVLVTRDAVRPYKIGLTDAKADQLAAKLRAASSMSGRRLPDYDVATAAELYRELLAPVEGQTAALKRIQIDAPGSLAAVPFSALVTEAPSPEALERIKEAQDYSGVPWLARRVAVASSVGPASFVRVRKAERPSEAVRAAAFGDFRPAPVDVARRLATTRGLSDRCRIEIERSLRRLEALPSTAAEAQRTAEMFGTASSVSLGEAFTDSAFFAADGVEKAGVIVLATHGVLGLSECFAEPALLASLGEAGDGLIEASELLDRRLSADLVVLSACDTAGGGRFDVTRTGLSDGGEALSGLARGFLYAGAASVLATQWQVDAESSSTQVRRFTEVATRDNAPLATALNEAQKTLYDSAETGHPFYWAAFVLIGDGGTTLAPPPTVTAAAGAPASAAP